MGDTATIRYSAMHDDGKVAHSAAERTLVVGMRELHGVGGDIGMATMLVGERCLLTCGESFTYPGVGRLTFDLTMISKRSPGEVRRSRRSRACSP